MALSSKDAAAVKKAATAGGLSSSQGSAIVKAANQNKVVNVSSSGSRNATPIAEYNPYDSAKSDISPQVAPVQPTPPPPAVTPTPITPTPPQPSTPTTSATAPQGSTTQGTQQQAQIQGALAMPPSGSVVDLLTSAGQDSSFAARQQLATQFGIQNYTGTAAQNTDLGKKYVEMYNKQKSSAVPQNAADARNALSTLQQDEQQTPQGNPTQQFMDIYGSMNPIEASIYQQLSGLLSTQLTKTSLVDTYNQLEKQEGITNLNLELADVNRIMDGTEDDLREEIVNAGGFATESQVQALAIARNKTLLKRATYLQDTINAKEDYVNNIVSLTKADREQVSKDLDQKLGITQMVLTMSNNMQNRAQENIKTIVSSVGWEGLAQSLNGDPAATSKVENMLGLAPGGLKQLASYTKPLTAEETLRNQNLTLQNQKLQKDLTGGGGADLQFVSGTANQLAGVFNKATGKFTPIDSPTGGGGELQMALANSNIQQIDGLLTSPGLAGSVGPNTLARSAPDFDFFTGVRSNFIAGVQQLSNQLTLTSLQNAKANGATFGALSEGELSLLSSSATKLNSWALKDGNGNVTGYNTSESNFKTELDKINNFAKLDFVLKGGDLSSVNVVQMQDGTLWTKNSDGVNVEIR